MTTEHADNRAILVLEDGITFEGKAFGATGQTLGEIVFNTGMTGYQEILTDPSYSGQIVTMTYPLIGNYGVNGDDYESAHPYARGFIAKESIVSFPVLGLNPVAAENAFHRLAGVHHRGQHRLRGPVPGPGQRGAEPAAVARDRVA